MSHKMRMKRMPMEGYCAECGSIKYTYGRPVDRKVHWGKDPMGVPCADWWHYFWRRMNYWNFYVYLNRAMDKGGIRER